MTPAWVVKAFDGEPPWYVSEVVETHTGRAWSPREGEWRTRPESGRPASSVRHLDPRTVAATPPNEIGRDPEQARKRLAQRMAAISRRQMDAHRRDSSVGEYRQRMEENGDDRVARIVSACGGNLHSAAKKLGMSPTGLRTRLAFMKYRRTQ